MLILQSMFPDFSAKVLVRGEPNVSYICSRYYRAPELIFGATDYTCQIGKLGQNRHTQGVYRKNEPSMHLFIITLKNLHLLIELLS